MLRIAIEVFITGVAILVAAILLNLCAKLAGLPTWYDYIGNNRDNRLITLIWLFIAYPFLLGLTAYIAKKLLD
jgi:hypothetical protein